MKKIQRARLGLICLALVGSAVSRGIGDIVASGLGLSNTAAITTGWSTNSSASSRVPNTTAIATGSLATTNTSSRLVNTTAITTGKYANASADSCWSSWTDYGAYSNAIAHPKASPVATIVSERTGYVRGLPAETFTEVSTLTGTSTQFNGGFAISTIILDSTATSLYTQKAREGSSYTRTDTFTRITHIPYDGPSVPVPTCQLSSTVPQCQSQWEAYVSSELLTSPTPPSHCDINEGIVSAFTYETQPPCASTYQSSLSSWRSQFSRVTKPPCTQASVDGQLCSTIKDAYVHQQNSVFFPKVDFVPFFSNGYLGSFANITAQNYTKSWWWPSSSTLGVPGCTLGCGRCAVTGNTVQLLYWPEATQTEKGVEHEGPVTISTLGTVLTSPTYYVSYRSVYASDGCSGVGPTFYNTIVPIPGTEQLSSVFGGTLPCVAHVMNQFTQEWTATASFNVTDLIEPVPFSIYSSQPWCATYQFEHGCKKECPTTEAYKPIIVVPEVVLQSMDPAWASCYGDIRGVYDPPIALTPVASVKVPQMTVPVPAAIEVTSATPASSPSHPAAETGGTRVLPDNPPSSSVGGNAAQVSQLAKPSQDLSGVGAGTVRPNDLPASNAAASGIVPHISQLSGSNQNVGDIIAAFLGGSASSNNNKLSSDGLSEAGVPKGHANAFSSSNVVGNLSPHGSQASKSAQNVGGLVAGILDGAENPVAADPASASQASYNSVAAVPPGGNSPSGSTAGDSEPQASWPFALDQDVGDTVASVLRDFGRLSGTGASVSRLPGSEWDSPPTSTLDSESRPYEASDSIMESQKGDQTSAAQPPGADALVTSQSSLIPSDAHNSDTFVSLPSDASTTISSNESGVNEPISTQESNADARSSADSSESIAASVSKAAVSSSDSERMMFSMVFAVIVSSCSVKQLL